MASSPSLPSDMCFEILTRTSLETLGRCRLVSKEWNHTTYDSTFMQQFFGRTNAISGFFVQTTIPNGYISTFVPIVDSDSSCKLSLNFLPFPAVEIEAAHQGMLVCASNKNSKIRRYLVCQPTTKQWTNIPNPKTRYFTEATAILVLQSKPSLRYKVVRFSRPKSQCFTYKSQPYNSLRCEVFDSNTWAWKPLKHVCLPYCVYLTKNPAVAACGGLHWLLTDNRIFTFYADKESWEIFVLPNTIGCIEYIELMEYQGKLGLIICNKGYEFIELWVIQDYKNKIWRKRQKLSITAFNETAQYPSPVAFCNSDVVLMKGRNKVIFYNFRENSFKITHLVNQPHQIFLLQSNSEGAALRRNVSLYLKTKSRIRRFTKRHNKLIQYIANPTFYFIFFLFIITFLCYFLDI